MRSSGRSVREHLRLAREGRILEVGLACIFELARLAGDFTGRARLAMAGEGRPVSDRPAGKPVRRP
jgi:hypothetical protein